MRGIAISRIPEEFYTRPHSKEVQTYLDLKYSKYGFRREHLIEYNREYIPVDQSAYRNPDKFRWVENVADGLRLVGDAHDIVRLNHTGWFTDDAFQDETVHGVVYQLPGKNGQPRFVPAVNDPCNDACGVLDFYSISNDKEECARAADSMAEAYAERERDYQAEESKKQALQDIQDEIKQEYADYRQTIRELRGNKEVLTVPVVRQMVREKFRAVKAHIRKLRGQFERIEERGVEY